MNTLKQLLMIGLFLSSQCAGAEVLVHRPTDDATLVLRLSNENGSALQRLRADVEKRPNDLATHAEYIKALMTAGIRSGNERYYGFAEQALSESPRHVQQALLLERAQLLQQRHEFKAAEQVLDNLLIKKSRNPAARLMRAQIRLHLHEPQQAMRDCVALVPVTDLLTSTTCIAQARMEMGDIAQAYALITAIDANAGPNSTRSWNAGIAAELAARLGMNDAATKWYRLSFELDSENHYPRIAYADWLISQGQLAKAQRVASSGTSNADRLRSVLAKQSRNDNDALRLQLAWREAQINGERDHLRDQARYELLVVRDIHRAHAIAKDNFADHRESEDALLLAQTASLVGDRETVKRLRLWQSERRYVDARLDRWMKST
jgi:hypothetical protein